VSDPPRLDVAEDVAGAAQKYDAMSGRIRFIPFEFIVRDFDLSSDIDVRSPPWLIGPVVGDGRVGLAAFDMNFVCPISVRLAAT
jgi:hypothetical protein